MILCVLIVLLIEINDLGRFGEGLYLTLSAVHHNLNISFAVQLNISFAVQMAVIH